MNQFNKVNILISLKSSQKRVFNIREGKNKEG